MGIIVDGTQVIHRNRYVSLRGPERSVSQHLLNRPEICSALQQVRCKAMSEHMWGNSTSERHLQNPSMKATTQTAVTHSSSRTTDEERSLTRSMLGVDPRLNRSTRLAPEWDEPFLVSFPPDPDLSSVEVYMLDVETYQLGSSESRAVRELEEGTVPEVAPAILPRKLQ